MTRHRDALIALAFAAWGVAGAFISDVQLSAEAFGPPTEPRWLVALSALPIAALLIWRRSHPRLVAAALLPAFILPYEVFVVPGWGVTPELLPPLAVFGIAAYSRSPRAGVRDALIAGVVFGAVACYQSWRDAPAFATWVGLYAYPLAGIIGAFAAGIALRDRTAELRAARERLREEESGRSEAERLDEVRMTLAREIHVHLSARIDVISRHVQAARAALGIRSAGAWTAAWVAAMRSIQEAAAGAMHGLRATLTMLDGDPDPTLGSQEDADTQLKGLADLDGAARGRARVRVVVDGRLPEPLRGLASLARRVAADGVELLLTHGSGEARVDVVASDDGVILRFHPAGALWWWRARRSVERARLVDIAELSGLVEVPRPWRRQLVVRLPGRPVARAQVPAEWRDAVRAIRLPLAPGMGWGAALVPVVLLSVLGLIEVWTIDNPKLSDAARIAGSLLTPLPFLYRSRFPLLVVVAVIALLLGRQGLHDLGTPTISQNFHLYVGMFVVGAYARSWWGVALGAVIVMGGGLVGILWEPGDYPADAFVFYIVVLAASTAVGVSVRRRVRQAAEFESVRAELAGQRRQEVAAAVARERMHVARELHDVVGHSVTVMAVQAGAAVALAERDPGAARTAAESVLEYESVVRMELDQLLRALRSTETAAPPPTKLADLAELIERSRRAGLPVRFESDGDLSVLAPWLIGTVYRIVQESLTNVRRHAGRVPTSVCIRVDDSRLYVEVSNKPGESADPRPGGGAGVAGMRERTLAQGGSFEAGPTDEGGWCVRATLPAGDRETAPA